MCGIAGLIDLKVGREALDSLLKGLERDLHHRGPDDRGTFVSRGGIAGLVSTRLAIQDVSESGHQPMSTPDGRFHIVFNGEIYNFQDLRNELLAKGETFKSFSDTEVILKLYQRYGTDCVREFEGMYALAIWDEWEESCFVARGPLGIKPLYYHDGTGGLIFSSELRALLRTKLVPRNLCARALSGYLLFGAVPEPLTLVHDVLALPAGHYLIWRNGKTRLTKFWDLQFGEEDMSREEGAHRVREALIDSVRRHLVSDVPVGIFLSGGIDSTALVALAAKQAGSDLRTFCISFEDEQLNEGDIAARTAAYFGTDHCDLRLGPENAKPLLEQFLQSADQPSIDGFNTFCVSKLAHDQGLKVVLSGLGGDEVFGGYHSFSIVPKMVRASRWLTPLSTFRGGVGKLLQGPFTSSRADRLGQFLQGDPLTSAAYWAMRGIFTPAEVSRLLPKYGCSAEKSLSPIAFYVPSQPSLEDEVSYLEVTRYMRNQLLRDSDVMSMAWGLELRVPFVDSKLIETVERIPAQLRLAPHKRILLDAVPEIPPWVRSRRKQGFVFPFREWIGGDWQDVFRRIQENSPIRLESWYRTWCLFALDSFVERNILEVQNN